MTTIESILVGFEAGVSAALTLVILMKFRMMPLLAIYVPKEQFQKMTDDED